jgi:glutamate/aspartate transport system substrate-binding protein
MNRILAAVALALCLPGLAMAQDSAGTLQKIKTSGTITMGFREQSVPFSFLGTDGKPAGYSIDLCQRIAAGIQQQLGLSKLDVKWVAVTPDTRISAVVQGTIDLECGSTTNTLARQEQVDFSHMTFVDGASLLVMKSSGIAGVQDLGAKRIAIIPATTTDKVVRDALQKGLIVGQIVSVKDHREGLAALEGNTADAYASDRTILIGLAMTAQDPGQFALADQYLSYEPYGLMLRRGDAPFRLGVNRVLSYLYRSGEIAQIYARWFGKLGAPSNLLLAMYALHALPE